VPTITDRFVQANGLRFHVRCQGPDDGPLVLLLHGFPDLASLWDEAAAPLASAGFSCVAPDLRGYGTTDRPGTGYDLATLRNDVSGLIDALGRSRAHVVGHDWGGVIAYDFAAHFPTRVDRLAVANGPHPADYVRRMWTRPQFRRSWYTLAFQLPWLPERWLTANGGANVRRIYAAHMVDRSRMRTAHVDALARSISTPGAARAALAYYRAMTPNLPRLLRAPYPVIHAPLRLIWGTADRALDLSLALHLDRYCDGPIALHTLDGVGHFAPAEAPERVGQLVLEHLRGPAA